MDRSEVGALRVPVAAGWKRVLFLAVAGVLFVLGVAGAFLPGLPATPFLILTSYLLIRSSPGLNAKLLRSRVFGPLLVDWQVNGGVRRNVKVKAIILVGVAVTLTIVASGYSIVLSLLVSALAAIGVTVIARLPTIDDTPHGPR